MCNDRDQSHGRRALRIGGVGVLAAAGAVGASSGSIVDRRGIDSCERREDAENTVRRVGRFEESLQFVRWGGGADGAVREDSRIGGGKA